MLSKRNSNGSLEKRLLNCFSFTLPHSYLPPQRVKRCLSPRSLARRLSSLIKIHRRNIYHQTRGQITTELNFRRTLKTVNRCHDMEKAVKTLILFLRKRGVFRTNSTNIRSRMVSVRAIPARTADFSISRRRASDATKDMSSSSSQNRQNSSPYARSSSDRLNSKESIMYLRKTMLVWATRES